MGGSAFLPWAMAMIMNMDASAIKTAPKSDLPFINMMEATMTSSSAVAQNNFIPTDSYPYALLS